MAEETQSSEPPSEPPKSMTIQRIDVKFEKDSGPLGMTLVDGADGSCVVNSVALGLAGWALGVQVGDKIVAVNSEDAEGWGRLGVAALIDSAGRPCTLTVAREVSAEALLVGRAARLAGDGAGGGGGAAAAAATTSRRRRLQLWPRRLRRLHRRQ